jgi:Mrp family chromosome partitioning ATPase
MVVRWQYTPRRAIKSALAMLEQDGTPVAGAVLSMASATSRAVGADNPAYYHQMFGNYYQA